MIRRSVLVFCLLLSLSSYAQETFDSVISRILNHNADLRSQASLIEASRHESADANALADPTVEFARVWGRHGIGNKLQLDISQELEWPAVYGLRSKAAETATAAARLQLAAQRLDLALDTKQQLIELVYVRKQLEMLRELQEQMTELGRIIDANREKEMVTLLDQRKITIELFKLDNQIAQLEASEQEIISSIQGKCAGCVLDLSPLTEYPLEPVLSAAEYIDQVQRLDPMLSAGSMAVDEQTLQSRVAAMQRIPSLTVGYQHQAEMGDRFNGFTVGMSLPFFQGRKAKAAAEERRVAASLSLDQIMTEKVAAVNNTLRQTEIWRSQTEDYTKVFGDRQYPVLLDKAYKGGEISVLEYISEIQYYTEATLTCLETDYLYRKALAGLNKYSLLDL